MKTFVLVMLAAVSAFAAPADFNASPGYGTVLLGAKGSDVAMEELILASETVQPDGQHVLSYNARVRNTGGGYLGEVVFWLDAPAPDWPVTVVTPFSALPDLEPNSAAKTTTTPVVLRCAAADVAAVKSAIADRQRVHITSKELFQFTLPVVAADENMDLNCTASAKISAVGETVERYRLTFASSAGSIASLVPGRLLIENPAIRSLNYNTAPSWLGLVVRSSQSLRSDEGKARQSYHLEITSAQLQSNGTYVVEGTRRLLLDVLRAGTFLGTQRDSYDSPVRDPYNPTNGGSFWTGVETANRDALRAAALAVGLRDGRLADLLGFVPLHYALNNIQVSPGIVLDGEIVARGLEVGLDLRWREAALKKVSFTLSSAVEVTLRLTAEATARNIDEPLVQKERTVFNALLPAVVIPIGDASVTIQPVLTGKIGCSVDAPTRLVVPMQSGLNAGFTMTWDDTKPEGQKFSYEPVHELSPPATSGPSIARALTAQASVWAETNLQVLLGLSPLDAIVLPTSAGPAVSARVQADFTVAPLATPWWRIDGGAQLRANLKFSLFGLGLSDTQLGALDIADLFHEEAIEGPAAVTGPRDQAAGGHVRWARAGKWAFGGPTHARAARVADTPEDVFVALRSGLDTSVIVRVNARGDIVWSKGGLIFSPELIVGTPDGGFVVGGTVFGSLFLSKYDGAGVMQWTQSHRLTDDSGGPQNIYPARLLVRAAAGSFELFVVGWRDNALNTLDADPFLLKYDGAGSLVFAKRFAGVDAEFVTDAAWAGENIVMVGRHKASPDGLTPPGAGAIDGGWLMTLSPEGIVSGTARTDAGISMGWGSVAVGAEGDIYTTGELGLTVLSTLPALQVARYDAGLALRSMVTLGEGRPNDPSAKLGVESPGGGAWNHDAGDPLRPSGQGFIAITGDPANPGAALTGVQDFLPEAGATVWDAGRRITVTPAGIIVSGTSALAENTAATVTCLNEQLSARWMLAHELRGSQETLLDVIATDGGLLCVGGSSNYFETATHAPVSSAGAAWLLKLPFDGKVSLHPGLGGIDKYLQPLVHDSIGSLDDSTIVGPDMAYHGTTLIANPRPLAQAIVTASTIGAITDLGFAGWIPLESGDVNASMTYAQWAAYQGLPAGSTSGGDFDGDGRTNGQEWFFGGDPFTRQSAAPFAIARLPDGDLFVTLTKSRGARLQLPRVETSTDLVTWEVVTLPGLSVSAIDAFTDRITFILPATGEQRRFYRAGAP